MTEICFIIEFNNIIFTIKVMALNLHLHLQLQKYTLKILFWFVHS